MPTKYSRSRLLSSALALFVAFVVALALPTGTAYAKVGAKSGSDKVYRIGFHLWKPGKIYDEAIAGIKDGLELEGIKYDEIVVHSDRSKEKAEENLRKLDRMGLDLIYSLSSAGTQIAMKVGLKTPVIATVINHPASLGVASTSSKTRLAGTSYYIDAKKQLKLYRSLFPKAQRVGMIFDSRNPAGRLAEEPFMRDACEKAGVKFVSVPVKSKNELSEAASQLLAQKVDMIVIPTNSLVYANLSSVLSVTKAADVPVVSMNKQGVENGALAALFADTYNLGRQTASIAKRIIAEGKDPRDIGFEYIPEPDVILNLNSASTISFEFPPDVLSEAAIVMQ